MDNEKHVMERKTAVDRFTKRTIRDGSVTKSVTKILKQWRRIEKRDGRFRRCADLRIVKKKTKYWFTLNSKRKGLSLAAEVRCMSLKKISIARNVDESAEQAVRFTIINTSIDA